MYNLLFMILSMLMSHEDPHVIFITIDGVRWQEIYNGSDASRDGGKHQPPWELVPNLYNSFVGQGIAIGKDSPIIATGPNHVSLPGYLEMTRGHASIDCQDNYCNPVIDQSIFWFFKNPAVFSSWPTISKVIPNNNHIYVNTPNTYRHDNITELEVINWLDHNNPDFLWVSLGDTDENGHLNDYFRYINSLQNADAFIGYLIKRYPNSTFIITTDHGRSKYFRNHGSDKDSERVWLMMKGPNIPSKGFVFANQLSLSNIFYTITDIEFNSNSSKSILSKIKK